MVQAKDANTKRFLSDRRLVPEKSLPRFKQRPVDKSTVIFPPIESLGFEGIQSQLHGKVNPKLESFLVEMSDEMARVPVSTADNITTGTGNREGWDSLKTASGYLMRPLGHPPFSENVPRRARPSNSRYDRIERELMSDFFRDVDFSSGYRHLKSGTTSPPFWSTDPQMKEFYIRNCLDHPVEILTALLRSDLDTLAKFKTVSYCYIQRRNQSEGNEAMKDRFVFTDDGKELIADKRIEGSKLARLRSRIVWAYPAGINWIFAYLDSVFRSSFLSRYEACFKLRGPKDFEQKIRGFLPLGVDIRTHDWYTPEDPLQAYCNHLSLVTSDLFGDALWRLMHTPTYSPPTRHDVFDGKLFGDADMSEFPVARGLTSGIAPNPSMGKLNNLTSILFVLDQALGSWVINEWRSILSHRHPRLRIMNSSDDMVLLFKERDDWKKIERLLEGDNVNSRWEMDLESPIVYLGKVPYINRYGSIQVNGDIVSYIKRWWAPERSAGTNFRPFPWNGRTSRLKDYESHPLFGHVRDVECRLFKEIFGFDLIALEKRGLREEGSMSSADGRLLTDPSRLQWDAVYDGVESPLVSQLSITVPHRRILSSYSSIIKGV